MKRLALAIIAVFTLSGCVSAQPETTETIAEQPDTTETMTERPAQDTTAESVEEPDLDKLLAADLADYLVFSFDNFQCWDGDDCKVIYDILYLGPDNTHSAMELSSFETSGYISSASGDKADVGPIVLQDGSSLKSDDLEPNVVYKAIFNTDSKVGGEYDSIYLESHGVTILNDYFGCFKSEARFGSRTPNC